MLNPLALVLAAAAQGAPADDATLFLHPERIPLAGGGLVTVERGVLQVPIVRADPSSRKIGVEVYRFRAAKGADPATPPVVMLHGGPGWPGLESTLETLGEYEDQILPMTAVSDLIVVGQRGIGSSKPDTRCAPMVLPDDASAGDPAVQEAALVAATEACRDYWKGQGYDLAGFNVIEAAHDVDDVRRLLGYDRITLWGGSFGSHWSLAVMRYHPEIVARAVLTGMEGPDHTYDSPGGVLAALERMAGEAELSSQLIEHVPDEGLIEAFRGVLQRLEQEPAKVRARHPVTRDEVEFELTADDVRGLALGTRGRTSSRRGATTWAADLLALHEGRYDRAAQRVLDQRHGDRGLPTASFFLLDCGSGITAERLESLLSDPAIELVGDTTLWYRTACRAWGVDLGDDFRNGFTTAIPTLMVQGTWDTSTPYENALELLPVFDDVSFVTVEGGSHGALHEAMGHSNGFEAAVMDFVRTGAREELPEEIRLPALGWAGPRS